MQQTFEIIISGQVQGVGFRPFVYVLAQQFQLKGTVCNNQNGVVIQINSPKEKAQKFLETILTKSPTISFIKSHSISELPFRKFDEFKIIPSGTSRQINTPLTPDFSICESCIKDIRNKKDRRFGYAFTTCTNCGPRYALTTKFPFERINTTVSSFKMCKTCQKEYSNPNDRRFHSQTNTCPECGVQLKLVNNLGEEVNLSQVGIIRKVADYILEGNIIAIKNTNGYLLCCDANNKEAIDRLRSKKQRPTKPFAVLYPSIQGIKNDFELSSFETKALLSPVAPIVILKPKGTIDKLEKESIAPDLNQLGIMLPSSALLVLIMDSLQVPIIATSGNIHGSPIISEETEAVEKLSGVADFFLHHNLTISFPQDDSVIRFVGEHQITLRRARGLAPNYLSDTYSNEESVLAMGAHLKSTFTFVPNSHIYVSPYYGNLDSYDVYKRYQFDRIKYEKLFSTVPKTILIDKHPQYQSSILGSELASKWNAKLFSIQHHKAHFASVLGEHQLFKSKEKILGVVWDGTGFGDDGAIWGGEFFIFDHGKIDRLTHFDYVSWIAADKMAKEPRLSLLSMLPESKRHIVKANFSKIEWSVYNKIASKSSIPTSSVGRIFDAVGCLLLNITINSYEGEAAMLLENQARNYTGTDYIDFLDGEEYREIPTKIIIQRVHKAMEEGLPKDQIANSFIHTLALIIFKIAIEHNLKSVACSGGVFQNAVLIEKLLQMAEKKQIELKFNSILSNNDENISIGQLWYHQYIKN